MAIHQLHIRASCWATFGAGFLDLVRPSKLVIKAAMKYSDMSAFRQAGSPGTAHPYSGCISAALPAVFHIVAAIQVLIAPRQCDCVCCIVAPAPSHQQSVSQSVCWSPVYDTLSTQPPSHISSHTPHPTAT